MILLVALPTISSYSLDRKSSIDKFESTPNSGKSSHDNSSSSHIEQLETDLGNHSNRLVDVRSQIRSLEKELGTKNNYFLDQLEMLESVNKKLKIVEGNLERIETSEQSLRKSRKKLFSNYLFFSKSDKVLPERSLLGRILIKKKLKEISSKYASAKKNHKQLKNSYQALLLKKTKLEKESSILNEIITDLNKRKNLIAKEYQSAVETRDQANKAIALAKAKKYETNNFGSHVPIELPVSRASSVVPDGKGLSISFDGREVLSSGDGQIAYVGELANYGNVLMIDHGENLRSVILGEFDPKISQGSLVKKGSIIAYSKVSSGSKIYFELRRGDHQISPKRLISLAAF